MTLVVLKQPVYQELEEKQRSFQLKKSLNSCLLSKWLWRFNTEEEAPLEGGDSQQVRVEWELGLQLKHSLQGGNGTKILFRKKIGMEMRQSWAYFPTYFLCVPIRKKVVRYGLFMDGILCLEGI
ncbi:hypothetical protein H5410_058659 [Solanum commersonii]|uniref:Uncharacterized protein n=1 Tax=Solanum commersonii TaxID=4109 RepID=A0A9J5WTB8_SOLCO|nr:hypothetical protein H5410_058659 [Solanum commersonii]